MDARFEENKEDSDKLIIHFWDFECTGWEVLTAFRRDCTKKGEQSHGIYTSGKIKNMGGAK